MKFLLSVCLMLVTSNLNSQISDTDFRSIDRWAQSQKLSDTGLVRFTHELIAPAENDLEKLRAIFIFTVHYLQYDYAASDRAGKRINQSIYDILQRRKGICWDYAQLISRMAGIAGIQCIPVTGFSVDLSENSLPGDEPDHAWNLVKIDDNFFLLDATWQSNTLGLTDHFKEKYKTDYFLTDPRLFIKNHFPSLPEFQLLECPLDFGRFSSRVEFNDDSLCNFNFRDSIAHYLSLPYFDQKMKEAKAIYETLPNAKNRSSWGHTILDKAIDLKEEADEHFEKGEYQTARSLYESALQNFTEGVDKTIPYSWQEEARAFSHLNYAQVLYRIFYQQNKSFQEVILHLKQARSILQALDSQSFTIKSSLAQIEYQLSVLE